MDDVTLQPKVREAYLAQHDTKHRQKIRSHPERFVKLCSEAGYDPELPTANAVTHYLSNFHEKNGSAKSLRQVGSYLKSAYSVASLTWLNDTDARLVLVFIKVMEEQDQAATRQSVPITTRVLLKWFKALPPDDEHAGLLKAMLLAGQCGLLRAGENTRRENQKTVSAGYRVADITWRRDGAAFTLALGFTKGNRSFGGDTVTIANATPVSAMRRYLLEKGLMDRPDVLLYPQYVTTRWLAEQVRRLARLAGDDPACFTPHGLRAGGATDLVESGVAHPALKAAGRWKSDACLIYFRSESVVSAIVADAIEEAWIRATEEAETMATQARGCTRPA
jgi:hypothetical protein